MRSHKIEGALYNPESLPGRPITRSICKTFLCWVVLLNALVFAADKNYVGACAGFAILSGDGRAVAGSTGTAVSVYKPQTGGALNIYAGRHLSDYLSVQANYVWNNNDLTLTSASFSPSGEVSYQQTRGSAQNAVIGDLLLYFRNRQSWVRPYLSAGGGLVHLTSTAKQITALTGTAVPPAREFTATKPALRVAVGADLKVRGGWSFRYTFSETLTANPISRQLSPPGEGTLKNFQNLFGFVRTF